MKSMEEEVRTIIKWLIVEREKSRDVAKLVSDGSQRDFERGCAYAFEKCRDAFTVLVKQQLRDDAGPPVR